VGCSPLELGEDRDIEFKAAQGGLPKSVWESISAFANTAGGTIVLGVKEGDGGFEIVGIRKLQPLLKDFWDTHNNPQKLNYPVCREADITTLTIDKQTILCIQIPQVLRQQRPIYINGNPIGGTFKRNFEGDYRCSEAEVRLMLRDAGDDPTDGRILEGFTTDDLDAESLMAATALLPAIPTILFSPKAIEICSNVWVAGDAIASVKLKALPSQVS
jgi:ATP-dependent DNA helicase RecG